MTKKRIFVNITKPEDVEKLVSLSLELSTRFGRVLNYTEVIKLIVDYSIANIDSIVTKA
jgi:hypothetical protein